MKPAEFVATLRAKGGNIALAENGTELRVRASRRVLTTSVTRYIERHKPTLLELLRDAPAE